LFFWVCTEGKLFAHMPAMEVSLMRGMSVTTTVAMWLGVAAFAQAPGSPVRTSDPQPIYRVTVVSRTLQAVNYAHRSGPTPIDLNGTVLLPHAKGIAIVESKSGGITIDAKMDHLEAPTKFGAEYLTYVLWAITPEGRPKNLGEVLVDGSNKAHINVTTDLQAFGLIVTAEPYYSVTAPSDVVVLENIVRPDTMGTREVVNARYDLMPRGGYVLNVRAGAPSIPQGRKVSYDQYEALLELYQAENAVQIARSIGADRLAPEPFDKAIALLDKARQTNTGSGDPHMVVSLARESAQTAEDARVIALKRRDEEQTREAQREQDESRIRAEINAEREEAQEAQAAQQQADADRAAADQARQQAQEARQEADQLAQSPLPPPPVTGEPIPRAKNELTGNQRQNRAELLAQLNTMLVTRDTPRGLVVTVTDPYFESETSDALRPAGAERLMRIASMLKSRPGLAVRVEGFTDDRQRGDICERRAEAVRSTLIRYGVAPNSIQVLSYGSSRPLESNATASGRAENRRVEIVVAGQSIGDMALWDRTYSLKR
jgi:outer membrane protein OmpA-like peptidoglycan-associated protein